MDPWTTRRRPLPIGPLREGATWHLLPEEQPNPPATQASRALTPCSHRHRHHRAQTPGADPGDTNPDPQQGHGS